MISRQRCTRSRALLASDRPPITGCLLDKAGRQDKAELVLRHGDASAMYALAFRLERSGRT
jgi:hypothetical protein